MSSSRTVYTFTPAQRQHLHDQQALIAHYEQQLASLRNVLLHDVAAISGVPAADLQTQPYSLDLDQGVLRRERPAQQR